MAQECEVPAETLKFCGETVIEGSPLFRLFALFVALFGFELLTVVFSTSSLQPQAKSAMSRNLCGFTLGLHFKVLNRIGTVRERGPLHHN